MLTRPKINTIKNSVVFNPIAGIDLANYIIEMCEDNQVNNIVSVGGDRHYTMETIANEINPSYSAWHPVLLNVVMFLLFIFPISERLRNTLSTVMYYHSNNMKFDKTIKTCDIKEYMQNNNKLIKIS
jgi:hypothetical protein